MSIEIIIGGVAAIFMAGVYLLFYVNVQCGFCQRTGKIFSMNLVNKKGSSRKLVCPCCLNRVVEDGFEVLGIPPHFL